MIKIAISVEAFESIARTLALGTVAVEPQMDTGRCSFQQARAWRAGG
jgi:hypothetical protein